MDGVGIAHEDNVDGRTTMFKCDVTRRNTPRLPKSVYVQRMEAMKQLGPKAVWLVMAITNTYLL